MKTKLLAVLFLGLFAFSGCTEFAYESDLIVRVQGLLSGNPRDGIIVQVFETRYDAEHLEFPVSPEMVTDHHGEIYLMGLEPGREYYVRIDALLVTKIKSTNRLREGTNQCTIRIL